MRALGSAVALFLTLGMSTSAAQARIPTVLTWYGAKQPEFEEDFAKFFFVDDFVVEETTPLDLRSINIEQLIELAKAAPDEDALFDAKIFKNLIRTPFWKLDGLEKVTIYQQLLERSVKACQKRTLSESCLDRVNALSQIYFYRSDYTSAAKLLLPYATPGPNPERGLFDAVRSYAYAIGKLGRSREELVLLRMLAPIAERQPSILASFRREFGDALIRGGHAAEAIVLLSRAIPASDEIEKSVDEQLLFRALLASGETKRAERLAEARITSEIPRPGKEPAQGISDMWAVRLARLRRSSGDANGALEILSRIADHVDDDDIQLEAGLTMIALGQEDDGKAVLLRMLDSTYRTAEDPLVDEALRTLQQLHGKTDNFDPIAWSKSKTSTFARSNAEGLYEYAKAALINGNSVSAIQASNELNIALEKVEPIVKGTSTDGTDFGYMFMLDFAANMQFAQGHFAAAADLEKRSDLNVRSGDRSIDCNLSYWAMTHPTEIKPTALPLCDADVGAYKQFYHPYAFAGIAGLPKSLRPTNLVAALGAGLTADRAAAKKRYSRGAYSRDKATAPWPMIFADAAWDERANPTIGTLENDVFVALQEVALDGGSQAVAIQMGGAAARSHPRLRGLIEEYQAYVSKSGPVITVPTLPDAHESVAARKVRLLDEASQKAAWQKASDRFETVVRDIEREFPDYFDLINPQAVSLKDVQESLAADEAVLLVVPAVRGTHSMAVTREKVVWTRSEWNVGTVTKAATRLLWDAGVDVDAPARVERWWSRDAPGYSYDRGLAYRLYKEIIEPVSSELAGKRHVMVVAGGVLSRFPLGMLVTKAPSGSDSEPSSLRQTSWLADDFAMSHLPSLQALRLARSGNEGRARMATRDKTPFVGVGDPDFVGASRERGGGWQGGRRRFASTRAADKATLVSVGQLARLPGTASELENMRLALGASKSSIHLGKNATEAVVRSIDLSNVGVLSFATHGVLPDEINGVHEAALAFTPPIDTAARQSSSNDGILKASEIAELDINADWVILSACNTSVPTEVEQNETNQNAQAFAGLARAFLFAGARNILASSWPVRDDVAGLLTVATIRIARENPRLSRSEALQRAVREIRNDPRGEASSSGGVADTWAHPNAWAPFTLIGDVDAGRR